MSKFNTIKNWAQPYEAHEKKQKISLKDVAAQTGVTFQQLQKYECGENRITVFRLIQIAKAIGIKAADIINN